MNSGWELATSDVTPLSFTEIPPPGAPEFADTLEPVTFPYKAASIIGCTVVPISSFADTEETALARLLLFTEDANPVTTTSSNLPTSSCNLSEILEDASVTCRV